AKCRGLYDEMQKLLGEAPLIVAVAHFPATLDQVRAEIGTHRLPYLVHSGRLTPAGLVRYTSQDPGPHIILVLSENLVAGEFPNAVVDAAPELLMLVAEHHFLPPLDERIIAFAATLDCRSRVTFHVSLEDPLIQAFVGQRMRDMLMNL